MAINVNFNPNGVNVNVDGVFGGWETTTELNFTAEYGKGYIMDGASLQTITLPAPSSGSNGNSFAVTGNSLSFFKIILGATQVIFGGDWNVNGPAGSLTSTQVGCTIILTVKGDEGLQFGVTGINSYFDLNESGDLVGADGDVPSLDGDLLIGNASVSGYPTLGKIGSLNGTVTVTNLPGQIDLSAEGGTATSISSSFYTKRIENTFNETQLTGIPAGYSPAIYYKEKGLIFLFPGSATTIGIIDIVNKTFSTAPTVVPAGAGKWSVAVRAWNNKVFLIPSNFLAVGIFDMDTLTLDTTTIPVNVAPFSALYSAAYVAPNNGMIYCVPNNSGSGILKIDPFALTSSFFGAGFPGDNNKFRDVVLSSYNGLGYCVPRQKDFVGIINSFNDTWDTTTIVGLAGDNKWSCGEEGSDLNLYFGSFDSNATLIVDPVTDTVDDTTIVGFTDYRGCKSASNDKIYFSGTNSTNVLIVDVPTQTGDDATISGISTGYSGLIATDMGELISAPSGGSGTSLVIQTGLPKISLDWTISAYSNRT